jgi:hypothetical protein
VKDEIEMLVRFCHGGVDGSDLRCEEGDCIEIRKYAADERRRSVPTAV